MAGHSRWAQVKHKKAATDAKKSQLFSKFVREIAIAAREGGDKPETNSRLKTAIERARKEGLPKENIERALARAKGGGDSGLLQEFLYEATAAAGVMLIIEGITDNKQRTLAEIRQILNKHNIRLSEPGSVLWNFEKIGSIMVKIADNPGRMPEEIELAIMDAGAEDLLPLDDGWTAESKLARLDELHRALEAKGIATSAAGPAFKPRSPIPLDPSRRREIDAAIGDLNYQNDIQDVYSNVAASPTA